MSFFNGHFERRVSHRKRDEFLPVLGAREPSRGFQALVERVAGKGVSRPKMGSPGGQVRTYASVRSATPVVSLSIPKINDVIV